MKCEKCGNEYPSQYYFATPTICNDCFQKLPPEEQEKLLYVQSQSAGYSLEPFPDRVAFGTRFLAALVDIVVFTVLFAIGATIAGMSEIMESFNVQSYSDVFKMQNSEEFQNFAMQVNIIFYFIFALLILPEALFATSLGKLIFGLTIAGEDRKRADGSRLFGRFALKHSWLLLSAVANLTALAFISVLSLVAMIAFFIGAFVAFSEKKQALHDVIAKTAVFNKRDILE